VFHHLWYRGVPRWYDLERDVQKAAIVCIEAPDSVIYTFAVGELGTTKDAILSYEYRKRLAVEGELGALDAFLRPDVHVFEGGGVLYTHFRDAN